MNISKDYNGKINSADDKKFSKYLTKLSKLEKDGKFGSKEHFELYEKILKMISFYMRVFQEIDNVTRATQNFNLEKLTDYEDLLQYKKHLNYLEKLLENDCSGVKSIKQADNNKLCNEYLNYKNKNGITERVLSLYQTIKKMKSKYYKLKV